MMGGSKPAARHRSSIVPRVAAFAMCLQFHVSKKSIPWTVAMAT